jgi:hypothetical protein
LASSDTEGDLYASYMARTCSSSSSSASKSVRSLALPRATDCQKHVAQLR